MLDLVLFLGAIVVVLFVLLIRFRSGGSGAGPFRRNERSEDGPIGYGADLAPPGTSRSASVNAPWFGRTHDGDRPQSHGPGE